MLVLALSTKEYFGPTGLVLLAAGCLALVVLGWRWMFVPRQGWCTRPRVTGWAAWLPWNLLGAKRCGYDLRPQLAGAARPVVCPECGSVADAGPRVVRGWREQRRLVVTVAVLLAAGTVLSNANWVRRRLNLATAPRPVLWAAWLIGGSELQYKVRDELEARELAGLSGEARRRREIELAIRDLGMDDRIGNAEQAMETLVKMGAWDALEAALGEGDVQRRQLAAVVLRQRADGWYHPGWDSVNPKFRETGPRLPASAALIRVTVEGLKDDDFPNEVAGQRSTGLCNAWDGAAFLLRRMEQATPELAKALDSTDVQQRFLAAVILAHGHRTELAERVVPVLVAHLRDNQISADAREACGALVQLGEAARPLVEAGLARADGQGRRLGELLLKQLDGLPLDAADQVYLLETFYGSGDPFEQAEMKFGTLFGRPWSVEPSTPVGK